MLCLADSILQLESLNKNVTAPGCATGLSSGQDSNSKTEQRSVTQAWLVIISEKLIHR